MNIYADGMTTVVLSNNNLRITLVQNGPDNQLIEAGTLILPITQATHFAFRLNESLKELGEQVKAQKQETDAVKSVQN
jgi:hypothetical protein